ncbi:MAG: FtsX-like permease family protein [Pseudomonadota bacterium]|nr:FtsX-like permease family protein [Pseudomonadota bacterium]
MLNFKMPFKLALLELKHGWKHFSVFVTCLVLGVAIMATVNTFGSVVQNALNHEAQGLLGGNIEVSIRGVKAKEEEVQYLTQYGTVSQVSTMRAMAHAGEEHTLVELKAIDENYPLIGTLEFNENITKKDVFKNKGVAVDRILLSTINAKLGDEIQLGEDVYTIRATLKKEPDRAVQIFNFGPRVMLSHASIASSKLVNTFSLVDHRYRILTKPEITADDVFENKLESELQAKFPNTSWRVTSGTDGNRMLKRFLNQLLSFLNLSGLSTFLIAGIGIASAVRSYLSKKVETIAVLKVQGARKNLIAKTYIFVLALLSLCAGVVGVAIAQGIVLSLMPILQDFLPVLKDSSGVHLPSLLLAVWYGMLVAFLFSVPALLSALEIRPALLFRSKNNVLYLHNNHAVRFSIAVFSLLLFFTLYVTAVDKMFTVGALCLITLAFCVFYLCVAFVKAAAKRIRVKKPWLKLALGNLYRPGATTGTVVFAIGISLMVLIALTLTESNFQQRIQKVVEERAPSLFMIDIQPHQKQRMQALLDEYSPHVMMYPMVRGRVSFVNGVPASEVEVDPDIDWVMRGDRGISYSKRPPENALISKGEWWQNTQNDKPLLSVDERILTGMDLKLGDTITLTVLGKDITATIANARQIDYSTFQINFAMMLSDGVINKMPHTSVATIHLQNPTDELEFEIVKRIANEFPGVTTIRTKEVVSLVQTLMNHIATALSLTVGLSLFAGLLVLASSLSSTIDQRRYDVAVLKVYGARKRDILKSCTAEWMLLALITSVISAGIGTLSAYLINSRLRAQGFDAMPEVTLTTILLCCVIVWCVGFVGNRKLFNLRPSNILRNE